MVSLLLFISYQLCRGWLHNASQYTWLYQLCQIPTHRASAWGTNTPNCGETEVWRMGCGPCLQGNFFSRGPLASEQGVTSPPTLTLFSLEHRLNIWYSYSLILQKFLRTVGNRWKNKMLWTVNLALDCVQELRSWASCQGGLVTS